MHGRIKVKTTAEQQAAKLEEQQKKLKLFTAAWNRLSEKRQKSDYDKETLELSAQILCKIPDVHTLWNIRRETFVFLKEELEEEEYADRCRDELAFTEHCLQVNPKSYGCWEHRCWILDNSPKPDWSRELQLCNKYLDLDERNFHCWDYRRFIVSRSKTEPEDEFKYTTDKISANFSNFSSWHYRSKLLPAVHPDETNPVGIKQDILLSELNMVQSAFFTDPNDQSAWFYHRWLLGKPEVPVKCNLVHLSADRCRLLARFTKPVKSFGSKISFDDETISVVWQPVSLNSKASMIWSGAFPKAVEKGTVLNLVIEGSDFELNVESDEVWSERDGLESLKAIEFGKAAKDVLTNELEMLRQLHDMEPDNKWAMLTIISLVRNLNPEDAMNDVNGYLEKLTKVDPYRENYYNDMRSKYVIENELRVHTKSDRNCDFSSRKLTCFYHAEHFVLITNLNLSGNFLRNLKGFHLLQNLQKLDVSRNKIDSIDGIGILPELETLDLSGNQVSDRENLAVFKKQPKLTKVKISGNSVSNELECEELSNLLSKCTS